MIEFIENLEQEKVGSRNISDEILLKLGWKFIPPNRRYCWFDPEGAKYLSEDRPDPSQSLDDSIFLIPEGIHWLVHDGSDIPNHPGGFASLHKKGETGEYAYIYGRAATPALAMCSALMRYYLEETLRKLTELGQEMEATQEESDVVKALSAEETKWR